MQTTLTMNDDKELSRVCSPAEVDPEAQCDECGVFGAHQFGDKHLCTDCYVGKGSCCPEFGKDDLWSRDDPGQGAPGS